MKGPFKITLVVLVLAFVSLPSFADFFTSQQSGNWRNPAVWGGNSGSQCPGQEAGRNDNATVANGHTVNWQGDGRGSLGNVNVNGTVQGAASGTNIEINATGNITVNGSVGGSATSQSNNPVSLGAGGTVTVNGTVEGNGPNGKVSIEGKGNVTVGNGGVVNSKSSSVNLTSKTGSTKVEAGGLVIADKHVGIKSGPGKDTVIDGTVKSNNGNVYINQGVNPPGDVTIGASGIIEAPNGEVYITADTLEVFGKIKAKTLQKKVKACIIHVPPGSIDVGNKCKNKIDTVFVAKKSEEVPPAEKAKDSSVVGGEQSHIVMSSAPLAIQGTDHVRVATGPGGVIDMRGNPIGTPVIYCPGPIEIFSNDILTDPGVPVFSLCGPGPVILGPSQPVLDVSTLCVRDTVGFPGWPGRVGFLVTNMGTMPELFTLTANDSLGWPLSLSCDEVFLDTGAQSDSLVTIEFTVPPPMARNSPQQELMTNRFWLTVTSAANPAVFYTETTPVDVLDPCGVKDVTLSPWDLFQSLFGDTIWFTGFIGNTGSVFEDTYGLTVADREGWELILPPSLITLSAGQDSIYTVGLVVPPEAEPGDTNEMYFTAQSMSCYPLMVQDTVLVIVGGPTGVDDQAPAPTRIEHSAYPNPFNPGVTIAFSVPAPGGPATLVVYDVDGRRVKTVFAGALKPGGYRKYWDGTTDDGAHAASGVYLYRITVGKETASGKLNLLK